MAQLKDLLVSGQTKLLNTLTSQDILPSADDTVSIGASDNKFKSVYANYLYGTAKYADYDSGGHYINGYYLPLSGGTMTGLLYSQHLWPEANETYGLGWCGNLEWHGIYGRRVSTRWLDADSVVGAQEGHYGLYIGQGNTCPTNNIYFYNSNGTVGNITDSTLQAVINNNGLTVQSHLGVAGTNTGYNFYNGGNSYQAQNATIAASLFLGRSDNYGLELYGGTPYIDFHYDMTTEDFTTRLIETSRGTLSLQGNYYVTGAGTFVGYLWAPTAEYNRNDTVVATTAYTVNKNWVAMPVQYGINIKTFSDNLNLVHNTANSVTFNRFFSSNESNPAEHNLPCVDSYDMLFQIDNNNNYDKVLCFDIRAQEIYYLNKIAGTWHSWKRLLHSGNYNSYSPTLAGGGAYGTWGIDITGSASVLAVKNDAHCQGCLQYIQTSAQTAGKDLPSETWWHVLKMNHGDGDSYYKRLLAFDFWAANSIKTAIATGNGTTGTWYKVWCEGNSVTSAVWNDYAEYRESDNVESGYVLIENGDDTLSKSTKRLQPFAGISSDTWGFAQGQTEKANTPIAVAGRVLVYPYEDRDSYEPGDCVCTAPEGKVSKMTREEIKEYPDRIVGTVSCVPTYSLWGGGRQCGQTGSRSKWKNLDKSSLIRWREEELTYGAA